MTEFNNFILNDPILEEIVDKLVTKYNCHTIILYGSRARGDYTTTSDYDVAGISKNVKKQRIAEFDIKNNVYLDIFIYQDDDFLTITEEYLKMADGIVLVDNDDFGKNLISKLNSLLNEPNQIPIDELRARKVWHRKMLSRALMGDVEGRYRHIWCIFAILEDYFVFKNLKYQGPKKAFQYLERHDQETLSLFEAALSDIKDLHALEKLIQKIIDHNETNQ